MRVLSTISDIARAFVGGADFDVQANSVLEIVGRDLGVSRAYLFIDSPDGLSTRNTHEWCAAGVEPQIEQLQCVSYAAIPSWKSALEARAVLAIENVSTLSRDFKEHLEAQGILSVVLAPVLVNDQVCGFLGFDECHKHRSWSDVEVETLKAVSGIVATAYAEHLVAERLQSAEENLCSLLNTADDIIVVGDLDGYLLFANEGASRKLGSSAEELTGKHILDLHPPDKRDEATRILEAMFRGELSCCPLELMAKDGARLPVETRIWFGDWDGERCIFGISKDLSAEQAALQMFERLFRNNPAAMAISGTDDRGLTDVNETFLEVFGYERDEVIGASSVGLGLFVDDKRWRATRDRLMRDGRVRNSELVARRKDGTLVHGLFSGDVIESQGQAYLLTVMIDITEQVELRSDLEAERTRLANIIEGTRLGTWEWEIPTGRTVFNHRWAEIIGYTLEELEPVSIDTWAALAHPDDLAESERQLNRHFKGETDHYECESRMHHKDGSWVWVLDRGKVVEWDAEGHPLKMYGTHSDITETKDMEARIRELAIRDPLTDVYDRRYILERLEEIAAEYARRGRIFCLAIIDIDHFKAVNDSYGHLAGDVVLKEFAGLLGANVRPYDLLGRFGGEEFIIVSPSVGADEAADMLDRIMTGVREHHFSFEGAEIHLSFSCGLADSSEFPRESLSVQAMLGLADSRLYQAKKDGRDRCIGPS